LTDPSVGVENEVGTVDGSRHDRQLAQVTRGDVYVPGSVPHPVNFGGKKSTKLKK
jgi:hypothetical protein